MCNKFTDTPIPVYTDACMTAATVPACYSNSHISADLNWFSSNDDTAYCACDDGSTKCNVGQLSSPAECATMCGEMTSLSPVVSNAECQFSMTTNQYVANENNVSLSTLQTLNINSGETEAEYLLRAEQACMNDSSCIAITRDSQTDSWSIVPGDAGWKVNEGPQDGWSTYTPPTDSNCTAESLSTANTTTYPFAACDMSKLNHVTGCGAVPGSDSSYLKNCVGCSVKDGELSCTSCSTCMGCGGETNPTWTPSSFDITTCTAGSDIVIDEASKGFKCSNPCGSSWSETKGAGNQQSMLGGVLCTSPYVYNPETKKCVTGCAENTYDSGSGKCSPCSCSGTINNTNYGALCGTAPKGNLQSACSTCESVDGINLNTILQNYGGNNAAGIPGPPSPVIAPGMVGILMGHYEDVQNYYTNTVGEPGAVKQSWKHAYDNSTKPAVNYWEGLDIKDKNGNTISDPWKYININNEIAKGYVSAMKQGVCYNKDMKDKLDSLFGQLSSQQQSFDNYLQNVCNSGHQMYSPEWFNEVACQPFLEKTFEIVYGIDALPGLIATGAGAGVVAGIVADAIVGAAEAATLVGEVGTAAAETGEIGAAAAEGATEGGDVAADGAEEAPFKYPDGAGAESPSSMWEDMKVGFVRGIKRLGMRQFGNFIGDTLEGGAEFPVT